MSSLQNYVPLIGSERAMRHNARVTGPANPKERIEVTIRVRKHKDYPSIEQLGTLKPKDRQYLSREEVETNYGATDADLDKIEDFAKNHHLTVTSHNKAQRNVKLSGTVHDFSEAFQVKLMQYEYLGGAYRGRTGQIHIPDGLKDIIEGVFGLDNRQQARPHIVSHHRPVRSHVILPNGEVIAKDIAPTSYTPPQVASFYDFPPGDGTGQCIAILEFGGSPPSTEDLQTYFDELDLPMPEVKFVSVDGSQNNPGDIPQFDGEVALDMEIAGAIAPKAKIVVYFAEFTEKGWVDALSAAIFDSENMPSVISISWGFAEGHLIWSPQAIDTVNNVLLEAALMGITVCCSSGDDGSNDQVNDGFAHTDFPAASPYVLTCGGTRLDASDGTISSEVVWNDGPRVLGGGTSGGGISQVFPLPNWQEGTHIPPSVNPGQLPGRAIPDVCGNADGNTGYTIRVDGQDLVFGGTSAVAPLWAGLIARINQQIGDGKTLGYFNPLLYREIGVKPHVFHDIIVGNNDTAIIGGYSAGKGWDACTGWGSPDGNELLKALQ